MQSINQNDKDSSQLLFYVVLLHHPVVNRHGETITTAVTNMDIHDISRTARTYGAQSVFLVTPMEENRLLVDRILGHWKGERSLAWHPDRVEAVNLVQMAADFDEVKKQIREDCGQDPTVVLTSALSKSHSVGYEEFRSDWKKWSKEKPVVFVFGTGWGVADSFYPEVHHRLKPIFGPGREKGYNHLSVRSAVAIVLDRMLGE